MKEFKINKRRALTNASIQYLGEQTNKVIEPLVKLLPQAEIPLRFVEATYGLRVIYKQEVLNQFTEFIRDNDDVFTEKVLSSKEFQDGMIVHMDSYFKLRTDEKLKLSQNIFYDFGKNPEKPVYPLERYNDTLEKLSDTGIRFLGFIETRVPQIKEEYFRAKMRQNGNTTETKSLDQWRTIYTETEPLKTFIEEHIKSEVEKKMKTYKGDTDLSQREKYTAELRADFGLIISELDQLGLIHTFTTDGLGWSAVSSSSYNLSNYGLMFTSVIKPEVSFQ